jgi:hypothetical protein
MCIKLHNSDMFLHSYFNSIYAIFFKLQGTCLFVVGKLSSKKVIKWQKQIN